MIIILNLITTTIHALNYNPNVEEIYCPDKVQNLCRPPSEHVACKYKFYDDTKEYDPKHCQKKGITIVKRGLSEEDAEEFLDNINDLRSRFNKGGVLGKDGIELLPRAYGLPPVKWDSDLAAFGQLTADNCVNNDMTCSYTKKFNLINRYHSHFKKFYKPQSVLQNVFNNALNKTTSYAIMHAPLWDPISDPESDQVNRLLRFLQHGTIYIGCGAVIHDTHVQCYITRNVHEGEHVFEIVPEELETNATSDCVICPPRHTPTMDCLCEPDPTVATESTMFPWEHETTMKLSMHDDKISAAKVLPGPNGVSQRCTKPSCSLTLLIQPIIEHKESKTRRLNNLPTNKKPRSKIVNFPKIPYKTRRGQKVHSVNKGPKHGKKQISGKSDIFRSLIDAIEGRKTFKSDYADLINEIVNNVSTTRSTSFNFVTSRRAVRPMNIDRDLADLRNFPKNKLNAPLSGESDYSDVLLF